MKLKILNDEIQVGNTNPQVGIHYAIPLKPTLQQLVDCATTVGLTYEDLGKLMAIVSGIGSLKPAGILERAAIVGVEAVLKLR